MMRLIDDTRLVVDSYYKCSCLEIRAKLYSNAFIWVGYKTVGYCVLEGGATYKRINMRRDG